MDPTIAASTIDYCYVCDAMSGCRTMLADRAPRPAKHGLEGTTLSRHVTRLAIPEAGVRNYQPLTIGRFSNPTK